MLQTHPTVSDPCCDQQYVPSGPGQQDLLCVYGFPLVFFVRLPLPLLQPGSIASCSVEDCRAVPKKHSGMQPLRPQMKAQALHCKVFVFQIVSAYAAGHKSCTSTQIFVEGADNAGASWCLTSGDNCGSFTMTFHIRALLNFLSYAGYQKILK